MATTYQVVDPPNTKGWPIYPHPANWYIRPMQGDK
jgi:hypothetical protein